MRILLAAAELELVPEDVAGHPAIRRQAKLLKKQPTSLLLDANQHAQAQKGLEDGTRRGRPDITHYTLLVLLESPLAKEGGLEVAVHTRNGELIRVRRDTRLPRGESRFQGLMAKVLMEGQSQEKDPLVWVEGTMGPAEALASFAEGPVLRLDEGGPPLPASHGDATLVLGAFPSGPWPAPWVDAAPETASVWDGPLNAWAVAAECVAGRRAAPAR